MSDSLSRAFVADIEVRADGTGRTVHGIVVPFNRVARVSDGGRPYDEMFAPGSFKRSITMKPVERVKLLSQHNSRTNPLGRATLLREDAAGLYGEFHVSKTTAGDEVLELLRDGALDSFSVGFAPIAHTKERGVTVRTEVGIREASLVTFGAYDGAMVGGVRSLTPDDLAELAQMLRESTDLSATSETDPADLGTSENPELARTTDEDSISDHASRFTHTKSRARARREGGPLS